MRATVIGTGCVGLVSGLNLANLDYEIMGANVQETARGIGLKNRIGHKLLKSGPGGDLADWHIAILGVAFSPNMDNMRDASSIDIVQTLQTPDLDTHARLRTPCQIPEPLTAGSRDRSRTTSR